MFKVLTRIAGAVVLTAALLTGALAIAPAPSSAAAAAAPSAGCAAVNGGAWNLTLSGTESMLHRFAAFDFAVGETINLQLTASSIGGFGPANLYVVTYGPVLLIVGSPGVGPFPTTVWTGSATIPSAAAPYSAQLKAGNGIGGTVTATSNVTCTPAPAACVPGTFSSTGLEPCMPAPPGRYVDTVGATSATACTIGYFQPNSGATSCFAADPGFYVPASGSAAAYPCMTGYFQPNAAGITCFAAQPGKYVDTDGAAAATPCPAGRYQPGAGMTSCVFAEPGTYVDATGAAATTPCPAGYYQPNAGATSCLAAQPGFFVPAGGAAAQTPCPPGTTSGAAAVECYPLYVISGFRAPVDNAPTVNAARAGQTVPLKFTLTDSSGVPVTTLTSVSVTVTSLACSVGSTVDVIEEYSAGGSGLKNLGGGEYQFNWKTPKSYGSSCKTMNLDVGDGVARTALFSFAK